MERIHTLWNEHANGRRLTSEKVRNSTYVEKRVHATEFANAENIYHASRIEHMT